MGLTQPLSLVGKGMSPEERPEGLRFCICTFREGLGDTSQAQLSRKT